VRRSTFAQVDLDGVGLPAVITPRDDEVHTQAPDRADACEMCPTFRASALIAPA
jgi:hypothetical protein